MSSPFPPNPAAVTFTIPNGEARRVPASSDAAERPPRAMLGNHLPVSEAGVHEVASFPGPFLFYGLE